MPGTTDHGKNRAKMLNNSPVSQVSQVSKATTNPSAYSRPPSPSLAPGNKADELDSDLEPTIIRETRQSPRYNQSGNIIPSSKANPLPFMFNTAAAAVAAVTVPWPQGYASSQHGESLNEPRINSPSRPSGPRSHQSPQGCVEPGLPLATPLANSTASSLATQAVVNVQESVGSREHSRKRSQTIPDSAPLPCAVSRPQPIPIPVSLNSTHLLHNQPFQSNPLSSRYSALPDRSFSALSGSQPLRSADPFPGGHHIAGQAAAQAGAPAAPQAAVYGRNPPASSATLVERCPPPVPEKDIRPNKEKSKIKLAFSKSIGIHKDKGDLDRRFPAIPSPGIPKPSLYGPNPSVTSLIDPSISSATSLYAAANISTSTLVPTEKNIDKEKHKHHFLSRQKNRLWGQDDSHLSLSSASSTSRPIDPNAPQPLLYSFGPSSSANPSAFAKSVSGLDLRHGGRGLRDKRKDDKLSSSLSNTAFYSDASGWDAEPGVASYDGLSPNTLHPTTLASSTKPASLADLAFSQAEVANLGATFGVPGITPDDAWPLLKARLLHIFEGQDPRPPIESFNSLVSVHLRRCIQTRSPLVMIDDVNELLLTGFGSLNQTLRHVPDDKLVPQIVVMWSLVFNTILPFMQAVFLPLDLEFKGHGPIMHVREAAEFWSLAFPESDLASDVTTKHVSNHAEDLDVRRMVLLNFRDAIFLPRFDALMTIFSRLSLESVDAGIPSPRFQHESPLPALPHLNSTRPGTASSNEIALGSLTLPASYPSSTGPWLDSSNGATSSMLAGGITRSRATSNTSAGSWHSGPHQWPAGSHPPPQMSMSHPIPIATGHDAHVNGQTSVAQPSSFSSQHEFARYAQQQSIIDTGARLTETVAKILQCISVLASVQSLDEQQVMMEQLLKTLKWNWLGRGRTGRQRRGFIGTKMRTTNMNNSLGSSDGPLGIEVVG